jgi:hypothetical protein
VTGWCPLSLPHGVDHGLSWTHDLSIDAPCLPARACTAARQRLIAMAVMDELVDAVARHAHLPTDQAGLAVTGVLRFLAARLPSPLFGELQARLDESAGAAGGGSAGSPPHGEPTRPA